MSIDYHTPQEMAQALIDADHRCQRAELDYQAALDHGSDSDLQIAALERTAAGMNLEAARRPLTLAMILTRSMDNDLALYTANAILKGETWMFYEERRREHLATRRTTQAEAWTAQPFVPALTVTEPVTLIPSHTSPYPSQGIVVTLRPGGDHTVTVSGRDYRLVQHGE